MRPFKKNNYIKFYIHRDLHKKTKNCIIVFKVIKTNYYYNIIIIIIIDSLKKGHNYY